MNYKYKIGDEIKIRNFENTGFVTKLDAQGLPSEASINGKLMEIVQDVARITVVLRTLLKLFSFFFKKS